jgi:hypothetical protein
MDDIISKYFPNACYMLGACTANVPFTFTHKSPLTLSSVPIISADCLESTCFVRSFFGDNHPSQLFVGSASGSGGGSVCGRFGCENDARSM